MARKNSEVKVKFVAETQDINNGLKSTQNEIKVLNSQLSLNAEKLKGASGDTNLLSERTNLLSDALAETQKKTELMNEKLQKAKELFGEDSKEVKDLESALNYNMRSEQKLQNEIDKCNAELNKQSDVTEEVCDSTEATGEALADFTASMDNAGAKSVEFGDLLKANLASDLILSGVEKLTDAVGSFAEKAVSGQKALNNFQGKTGMAADKMQEFEDIMYNVYMDNFGEGLEDIADVMATIHQQTGQTGDELQNTTERAILLRDTFGWEVSESIRAANSMMNQFGISSEEAFDLMVQGAQKGLDQNDDLLDTINEYSVQFKDAGYSAQDMFNMLANGAESGTWSIDKLGDAVKEYHISQTAVRLTVDHYADSDFQMIIYGPATDINITIADHPYIVHYQVEQGEYLTIDSRDTQPADRRIFLVKNNGEKVNVFNYRDSTYSVLQKIPPRDIVIDYSRLYGVDLTLFLERSEPKWI